MCDCRKAAASRVQITTSNLPPGEEWEMECRVIVRRLTIKRKTAERVCGLVTQGGISGLHAHHLTAHPDTPWRPVVGHP